MKNKNIFIVSFLIFSMILASCKKQVANETQTTGEIKTTIETTTNEVKNSNSGNEEIKLKLPNNSSEKITLNGNSISYSGNNASVDGNKITINKAGDYEISGTLTDGQIIVDTTDSLAVNLILNGVSITNSTSSTIYVKNGKQTIITLVDGSTNTLTDGEKYTFEDENDEPNATIFSKDDLIIMGNGTLKVNANYNDGIASKDTLVIKSGNIEIISVDDGMRGKDLLQIDGGNIKITSTGDSLKSDNEEKGEIIINAGDIKLSSGDDGVHAEISLTINGGNINITKSYEGLESKTITINGGNINIVSSDDGINVAGGNDGNTNPMDTSNSNYYLYINGGKIYVNASGDGLDANGSIIMTGGEVYVNGPTSNGNGALDYDKDFKISGGTLIAAGSSGMAQNIGTNSTQNGVLIGFDSLVSAGTKFEIKDSSGNIVATFTPSKNYQSIVVSNSSLKTGETHTYYVGGEEKGNFTISSIATKVGNISNGMGGMGGGRGERGTPPEGFGNGQTRPTPPDME